VNAGTPGTRIPGPEAGSEPEHHRRIWPRLPVPTFGGRRWDSQPAEPAAVLLASAGQRFPRPALQRSVDLCGGSPIAVVTIARVYGSSFGLPNPGLLPTQAELAAQRRQVAEAISVLEHSHVQAGGQVAATRHPAKAIARAATAHGVRHVVVVLPADVPRWRRVVEGNLVNELRRRLPRSVAVEAAPQC
jgi:hypothetical protein